MARIRVQVTIYRGLLIGRDGHLIFIIHQVENYYSITLNVNWNY